MSVPIYSERHERVAISDLVRELFAKISELINTQIELAKTEVKVESRKLLMAAVFGMAAFIVGFVTVFFLGVSLIFLLSLVMGLVWASVTTTLIYLAVTAIAGWMMVKEIQKNSATMDVS